MNKNPFVPQPSYPTQPPLPPGPPPAGPTQDYNAYWAQAAAQHQAQAQPAPYNPQWSAPQPPQARPPPPPQDAALYANYGYGGQAGLHWQQQGQRQGQPGAPQYPAPPAMPQAPAQPAYNPYNPAAGYHPPYVPQGAPQAGPMAIPQYPHQQPPPPPQQQYYPQPPHSQPMSQPPQQQQQHQQRNNNHLHHTPPHQLPPAKRQRFEGPNHAQNSRGGHHQFQPPSQPQFQAPPPAMPQQQPIAIYGNGPPPQNPGHARGGGPAMPMRGGAGGNRGGSNSAAGRGGRGGSMNGQRGGAGGARGGRGGGSMYNGGGMGGGRGGGSGQAMPLRGHGSTRGNFSGGNMNNRRGGSFAVGGHQGSGNASFRGGGGRNQQRGGGRHDGGSTNGFGARDGVMASSFSSNGKKDENRRTLTDFKIIGLEMRDLDWSWGILPGASIKEEEATEAAQPPEASAPDEDSTIKEETSESDVVVPDDTDVAKTQEESQAPTVVGTEEVLPTVKAEPTSTTITSEPTLGPHGLPAIPTAPAPPPPSRIRIYFHTPVSADDSHPIIPSASSAAPSELRKGKRKKLEEDDDGDIEDGREPKRPPPQQMGSGGDMDNVSVDMDATGRGSMAPSVAETASEGDWLMAAINEDEDREQEESHEHGGEDAALDEKPDVPVGDEHDGTEPDNDGTRDAVAAAPDAEPAMDGHAGSVSHDHDASPVEAGPNGDSAAAPPDGDSVPTEAAAAEPAAAAEEAVDSAVPEPAAAHPAEPVESVPVAEPDPQDIPGLPAPDSSSPDGAAQPDPSSAKELSADATIRAPLDAQVQPSFAAKPLQPCSSLASTVPDVDAQGDAFSEDGGATAVEEPPSSQAHPMVGSMDAEADLLEHAHDLESGAEHLPEPPASPASNTLLSTSSGSTYGGEPGSQNTSPQAAQAPMKLDGKPARTPSANRLSISYAAGSRRLVIDAGVVDKLRVFRSGGRIEVIVNIERDGETGLKGIVIEGLSEATKSYAPLVTLPADPADATLPTFARAPIPTQTVLVAHLDTARPLSEPKWVKSGDVQEWLKSMFGRMFWVAGEAADGWEKKIEVVDPDPAPTIWTVLEGWATHSPAGALTERQRFLKTHMHAAPANVLEVLLRLVRGERATPFAAAPVSGASLAGPLLAALSSFTGGGGGGGGVSGSGGSGGGGGGGGFAHGDQQTHVSLAVLAMWQMAREYAARAGAAEVAAAEERVGEIIRCLPSHLLYKSLDGMFKEWKLEKKGGRA
ncbi:hypothetical protein HWV62_36069 [Athelia sp. TMB]|nr:hypothetical protein HWV62_36069 [Athelia sp. TMB]